MHTVALQEVHPPGPEHALPQLSEQEQTSSLLQPQLQGMQPVVVNLPGEAGVVTVSCWRLLWLCMQWQWLNLEAVAGGRAHAAGHARVQAGSMCSGSLSHPQGAPSCTLWTKSRVLTSYRFWQPLCPPAQTSDHGATM